MNIAEHGIFPDIDLNDCWLTEPRLGRLPQKLFYPWLAMNAVQYDIDML